ncbi:MAG: type 4a pilus biogenesis protein PilO [Pseudomonadota bacterium]|nr:type 4a pilus biogenesis protein PilO [Pseudomonadota bacterium]MDP1904283.1 type 4a pilus biogenesis protein PilO [Pseudomonadota bacterium]MDP2351855.1 type 4a pilus biogenesis protein PilO [Pseudomonadota bacterium]
MNFSDLNNLDLKDIANAPLAVRALALALLLVAMLAGGWYLLWADSIQQLNASREQEQSLREAYVTKKALAYNYAAYKQRLLDVEQSLASLLRQLPNRSEMDALLTDINQAGVGHGLDFELFRPGNETMAEFYATLPVAIKVTGRYHDIASFVGDLSKLPRIVTLHDVILAPAKEGTLNMDARIQTYRYLDENELAAAKKQQGGKP